MAINRILGPSPLPLTTADYEAQNNLLAAGFSGQDTVPWSGSAMQIGAVFQVGGTVYRVDTSTAITGTPSPYVRITPAGATASASFVANLSGVTWNTVFNGYYDGSGNRYLFDEALALTAGAIASSRHIASISASVLAYLRNAGNLNAGTLNNARTAEFTGDVTKPAGSGVLSIEPSVILSKLITVDGPGSGLDSATVSDGYSLNWVSNTASLAQNTVQTYNLSSSNTLKEIIHFTIAVNKTGSLASTANFRCSVAGIGTWRVYFSTTNTSIDPGKQNMGIDIAGNVNFYTYTGINAWQAAIFGVAMRIS